MAGPQQTRIALFISAFIFILMTRGVNSASSPSCRGDDCPKFIPGAVGYWPMTLETKGSDMSGNGNHAALVGLSYTDGRNGEPNSAVHFHNNRKSYSWITMSPSMDVAKYPGFSFCGFVRLPDDGHAPLIDWRDYPGSGMHIWADRPAHISINLRTNVIYDNAEFPNLTFTTGTWRFFGVSYDKATGRVTGFMDGMKEQKQIVTNLVAATATSRRVGIGTRLNDKFYHNGDMSCLMLLKVALTTAEDFERVWNLCRTRTSTQTTILNITVSDITTTTATATWTEPPGTFSGYSITVERNSGGLGQEAVYPMYLHSPVLSPRVSMVNLIPGATYRVHIWHMMGAIKRRSLSPWFDTKIEGLDRPELITFTMITATSATVNWEEGIGEFDAYYIDIFPTTGGAKVNPSTVPKGTTTTSLQNLSPASYYTITIRTKIGSGTSSPSVKSFQTPASNNKIDETPSSTKESLQITDAPEPDTPKPDTPKPDTPKPDTPKPEPPIAVIGLVLTVICLVVIIALVAVIVILFRRITSLSSSKGDVRNLPMSNLGFQPGDPSILKTKNEGEYDGYEVPDRSKYGGNSGSRPVPH